MVMIKTLLLLLVLINCAWATPVSVAFRKKNFQEVVDLFKKNPEAGYIQKDLVMISFSLRKLEYYRQDIRLSSRLIKERYKDFHKKIVKHIQNHETIDPEEYPEALKVLYWNIFIDYGKIIESYNSSSELIAKDHQKFTMFSKILSELEFRETKADKFSDKLVAHIQYLKDKVYKSSKSLSISYVSWQSMADLKGPSEKAALIITNKGICAGGDVGIENHRWHFYVDGCAFMGSGSISSTLTSPTYQQSNVPAYGVKISPGASVIVSSSKSRIGFRIPMIYSVQNLTKPSASGYDVTQRSPLDFVTSIYSRWQFNKWYFQTEFGKYVQKEQTFWGFGLGKNF
jgi:hypothetical protein